MAMKLGNADCTEGLSKTLFDYWVADSRNGFITPLSGAGADAVKAMCWAISRSIVDYVESTYPE